MGTSMNKQAILAELSQRTGQSKKAVDVFLKELAALVYREAGNDFSLPGLCKFKVVKRKQAKRFNVATGKHYLVAAHDVLKIVPLKKAKLEIAPPPENLFLMELTDNLKGKQKEITPKPPVESKPTGEEAKEEASLDLPPRYQPLAIAEEPSSIQDAPHKKKVKIDQGPATKEEQDSTALQASIPHKTVESQQTPDNEPNQSPSPPSSSVSGFVTFYCDDCGQEIEAPVEMIGLNADCPACGSRLEVPKESQPYRSAGIEEQETKDSESADPSTTIRMDLSDFLT